MTIGYAKHLACDSMYSVDAIVRRSWPHLLQGAELTDLGPSMAPLELNEDFTPKSFWPVRQIRAVMEVPGRARQEWLVVAWVDARGDWNAMKWPGEQLPRIPGAVLVNYEWVIPEPKRVTD